MDALDEFIRAQIASSARRPSGAPDRAWCLEVRRVAARSVAAAAGISPGDLLAAMDGRPGLDEMRAKLREPSDRRSYTFVSPDGAVLDLATTGIDPGVHLAPTPEAAVASFDPREHERALEDLLVLWEARAWEPLERLAAWIVHPSRRPGVYWTLFGWASPRQGTPALALLGAALWERGRRDEGLALIREYETRYARGFTRQWMAIARYYHACQALADGRRDDAKAALLDAFANHPFQTIADALAPLLGARPKPGYPWVGRPFPVDYALPTVFGGAARTSLSATLRTLQPNQVHVVCMLANHRANGPYSAFLSHYVRWAPWFRTCWPELHVVTTEPSGRPELAGWLEAEDRARAARLPVQVLLDGDGRVTAAIDPPGSPHFLVLDARGTVVHEGDLDVVALWDALAAAHRAR